MKGSVKYPLINEKDHSDETNLEYEELDKRNFDNLEDFLDLSEFF